jgi:chlorobactene glucosyltransferase
LDTLTLLLHLVKLSILGFIFLILLDNLLYFKRNRAKGDLKDFPLVSVMIPARNEEKKIDRCLRSVISQDYPNLEILVYDDHSEDRTALIVKKFEGIDPRIKLISPSPLPPGWMGKNYACFQLSKRAKGELFLFLDADTILERDAIRKAVELLKRKEADLLSFMPQLEMDTVWEKLILPLIPMAFLSFLPLRLVERSPKPELSGALGPFMLFKGDFYKRIGGHEGIKSEIVDDLVLARSVKEWGGRAILLDGKGILSVKFYHGFKEIWWGFTKSAFGAFEYSLLRIGIFVAFAWGVLLHPVFALIQTLLLGVPRPDTHFLIAEVALIYGFRALPDHHYGYEARWLPLFPLSLLLGILTALNSVRWGLFKKGVLWKDRFYAIPGK